MKGQRRNRDLIWCPG